jgi:hypothetical protein
MNEHFHDAKSPVHNAQSGVHEATSTQVRACKNNNGETCKYQSDEWKDWRPKYTPYGKTSAPMARINPAAFSWNHGELCMLRWDAHAKERIIPALTELKNTLSILMFPLTTPARDTSSVVSRGVYVLAPILESAIDQVSREQRSE